MFSLFYTNVVPQNATGGIIGVNRRGQVLSVTVDENNIVPYICSQLNDFDLAIKVASKNNLPGAEDLVTGQFNQLFQQVQLMLYECT